MIPTADLPVHFLTIVLNGEPFIRYHINLLRTLPYRWHWHIVEGVADLCNDTGWSLEFGGKVPSNFHQNGLSIDGTSEYLDKLAALFPENVSLYRTKPGDIWKGKKEMVNAPLASIREECLLWQLDVDEYWTREQLVRGRELFLRNPDRTAAWYNCRFYVGPHLIVMDSESTGHRLTENWLRTWRYKPGYRWQAHEPPILTGQGPDGASVDIGNLNPFLAAETQKYGLVFQHKAYVLAKQLQFKELYYGYQGIVMNWLLLQKQTAFPVQLKEFFPWPFVSEGTQVIPDDLDGIETIPVPEKRSDVLSAPRSLESLSRFMDQLAADVYPEKPSLMHAEITERALEHLEKLFPLRAGMRVVDVGCGQGPALEYFRTHQMDYLGVTLGEEDLVACRAQGFNVEKMDQSFLVLPEHSHDLIWARHVIEHSIFPLFTLNEFNKVLRNDGMLYLEVPAPETSCHHERNPNHYSVLSKGAWRSLIERSGFTIAAEVDYSFVVPAGPDTYWGFYCRKNAGTSGAEAA